MKVVFNPRVEILHSQASGRIRNVLDQRGDLKREEIAKSKEYDCQNDIASLAVTSLHGQPWRQRRL